MPDDDIKAELERLKAENEQLKSQRGRSCEPEGERKGRRCRSTAWAASR